MFENLKLSVARYLLKGAGTTANVPFVSFIQQRIGSFLYGTSDEAKYLKEFRGWVYACVKARTEGVKNINLRLYKGDKEITESPLLDLIYTVNKGMTKTQLFEATQGFLDLDGNCFWWLARKGLNSDGEIESIYVIRPDRMQIIPSTENPLDVAGYVYIQPDGKKIPFNSNEIIHFKNFNPSGDHPFPHRGLGIVQAAAFAIDTDNEAKVWNLSFFKNAAVPNGVLVQDGPAVMSDSDYLRIRREWEQNHQGSDNASKIAILGGGLKWQDTTRSQKDMDFTEQRRFSRDEILAMFAVPKTALGIVEDVNRANAEATNFVFADRTIKPAMETLVEFLNEYLVPDYGDDLQFTFDSPVPEDKEADLNAYDKGVDRWITRNEIRNKLGLDPIKGGDILTVPLAVQEITNAEDYNPDSPTRAGIMKRKVYRPKRSKRYGKTTGDVVSEKLQNFFQKKKNLTSIAKGNYITLWKQLFDINEAPLKKDLKKYFAKQEKEVQANLKKVVGSKDIDDDIDDILPDFAEAIESAISLITPRIQQYINASGGQAMQLTGSGLIFDNSTATILDFINKRSEYFAKTTNETTRDDLFRTLSEGLKAGETPGELSERVASVYGQARDYRTDRIARTEISAAANYGSQEAYTQAGVEKWQWVVVDPKDEDCADNDGEIVVIGDNFSTGYDSPPVHPNCQCTTIPIFD